MNYFLQDLKWFKDTVADGIGEIVEIVSTSLLISNSILVDELTENNVREKLHKRRELTMRGVNYVLIQNFATHSGCTVVTLAALNSEMQQVGILKMHTEGCSTLRIKQKIKI